MPIKTADDTRSRIATPLSAEQLDTKYGLVEALINTAADEGQFRVAVSMGSTELAEFTTWVQGYGYKVSTVVTTTATQIRKIVGNATEVTVFWNKLTPTMASQNVVRGNAIYTNLTSVGFASSTVYWTITGTVLAQELLENTLTGSASIASDGTATVTLNPLASTSPGRTFQMRFYRDSNRNELVATAALVTITA
jgi:hypothetical protein